MARAARRHLLVTPSGCIPHARSRPPFECPSGSPSIFTHDLVSVPALPCNPSRDDASSDFGRSSKRWKGCAADRDAQLSRNTDGLRPTAQVARASSVFARVRAFGGISPCVDHIGRGLEGRT